MELPSGQRPQGIGDSMRRLIEFLIVLVVVLFGLSFALLNAEPVALDYYLGTSSLPLSLALVIAAVVGALLGVAVTAGMALRQRREAARLRRRAAQLEKELHEIRKLPVRDTA